MKLLTEIQSNFFNRQFDFEAHMPWFVGLLALCGLIVIFILMRWLLARNKTYTPVDRLTDKKEILNVLGIAFDQRRLFEVQVASENFTRRPTLRCSPDSIEGDSLNLELSSIKHLSETWLGRSVSVYFRVKLEGRFSFYAFSSSIKGIHVPKVGTCVLSIALPQYLDNRQKRSFLRIQPPEEYLLGCALWYGENMPGPDKLNDLTLWPRPLLLSLPNRLEQFHISDLSAGGIRILIPYSVIKQFHLEFFTAAQLMLMIDLQDPEQNKRSRFWLLCRVQSAWLEHVSRDVQVGMQFLSWARPKEPPNQFTHPGGALEWLRLSNIMEVEPLGNWIMRRHLELFRDANDDDPLVDDKGPANG